MWTWLPKEFNFYPQTWTLPTEKPEFIKHYKKIKNDTSGNINKYFILKPESGSQGRGISLINSPKQIPKNDRCIIQEYLNKPFLYKGLKFDLRIYVLILSCSPLRVFLYKDGLVRLATQKYKEVTKQNAGEIYSHLTNFSLNKNNEAFVGGLEASENKDAHKRSILGFFEELRGQGVNTRVIWNQIKHIITKTVCTIQPILSHHTNSILKGNGLGHNFFELLGFDVMLDDKMKPYLLEINHMPSFSLGSFVDKKVKTGVIRETLLLVAPSLEKKRKLQELDYKRRKARRGTQLNAIRGKEDWKHLRNQAIQERDVFIDEQLMLFEKIYPSKDQAKNKVYKDIMRIAKEGQHSTNNNNSRWTKTNWRRNSTNIDPSDIALIRSDKNKMRESAELQKSESYRNFGNILSKSKSQKSKLAKNGHQGISLQMGPNYNNEYFTSKKNENVRIRSPKSKCMLSTQIYSNILCIGESNQLSSSSSKLGKIFQM